MLFCGNPSPFEITARLRGSRAGVHWKNQRGLRSRTRDSSWYAQRAGPRLLRRGFRVDLERGDARPCSVAVRHEHHSGPVE